MKRILTITDPIGNTTQIDCTHYNWMLLQQLKYTLLEAVEKIEEWEDEDVLSE